MKYGRILSDSWKWLWHSWALWGFVGTWIAIIALLAVGIIVGMGGVLFALITSIESGGPDPAGLIGFMAVAAVLGLAMIPAYWMFHAGSIYLSNEAFEGRPVRYSDGWGAGMRRFGSIAGFELLVYVILGGVGFVLMMIWGVILAVLIGSGDNSGGAIGTAIAALCFMYVIMFVVGIALALFIQAFEAVGARAAVLSGRGGMQSFKDAWGALRHSFKSVLTMSLIVIGVSWGYSMLTGAILTPLQFMLMPQFMFDPTAMESADPAALLGSMTTLYVVYGGASILLSFPLTIFMYLAWTGFYRQLVGIESAPVVAPAPAYAGYATAPFAESEVAAPLLPEPPVSSGPIPPPPAPPGLPEPPVPGSDGQ